MYLLQQSLLKLEWVRVKVWSHIEALKLAQVQFYLKFAEYLKVVQLRLLKREVLNCPLKRQFFYNLKISEIIQTMRILKFI